MNELTAVVVATHATAAPAHTTARTVLAAGGVSCLVVDVDGTYEPIGQERVLRLAELVHRAGIGEEARLAAATLEPEELEFYAAVVGGSATLAEGAPGVALLAAGVVVLGRLDDVISRAGGTAAVLPRVDPSVLGHTRTPGTLVDHAMEFGPVKEPTATAGTLFTRSLVALGSGARVDLLRELAADWRFASDALDAFATTSGAAVVCDDATLVSAWRSTPQARIEQDTDGRLLLDDVAVTAVDLSRFDPDKPWIIEPEERHQPTILVSEHPALAGVLGDTATEWRAARAREDESADRLPARHRFDAILRQEARRTNLTGGEIPDLLGTLGTAATVADIQRWATTTVPVTHPRPVARYLAGVRASRQDLMDAFPNVPGPDSRNLATWATTWGLEAKRIDNELVRLAGEATLAAQPAVTKQGPRPSGVNLVGYLSGELGLGESGRLVDAALHAAGEATSTFDVSRRLRSRQSATYRASDPVLYDTTLLCVNGGETPDVIKQLGNVTRGTHRIGMWYWELEDFHIGHAVGFRYVDEVWAATDFIRDSIAAKSPGVPVRTVMPPLPQRDGAAGPLPERFGIDPSRPFFLFTFDFLSLAGRKNPYGLVDAFLKAFPVPTPDGPQLVIKTINGDQKAPDAERLRLQMASRDDLILIEEYLPNDERHVLVAHCTAYVSLHKAEGLGLTLAEAMAWGKPVIATRYGGVVQFMNDENSFLIGWEPGVIPEQMGPYEKGLAWAEPDLDEAAAMMRVVIEEPERAAAIAKQAERDIRELHNVEVAGARMREVIAEGRAAKAAKRAARRALKEQAKVPAAQPRSLAHRVAGRARRELRQVRSRARKG